MLKLEKTLFTNFQKEYLIIGLFLTVSLISFWVVFSNQWILIHTDAIGHLNTARKIVLGTPPGLGQLGGIWLPLQHLLLLPLVVFDPLYYSGIAGSIISMISYVVACLFLYKLVFKFTKSFVASIIGTSVFALNPNVLLYQAAPMLELLFFATVTVSVYFFSLWEEKGKYQDLAFSGFFMLLAGVTRFEAWSILMFFSLAVILITALKRKNLKFTQAHLVYFLTIAASGIFVWILFLAAIFGDPLFFMKSIYSPSAYVEAARFGQIGGAHLVSGLEQVINLVLAVLWANTGTIVLSLGVLGLVVFAFKTKMQRLSPYSLLVPVLLYVFLVETNQLLIYYDSFYSYQVRYGMVILLPLGFFIGYLFHRIKILTLAVGGLVLVSYILMYQGGQVATFNEAKLSFRSTSRESNLKNSAAWLRENYSDGRILMALFLNEEVLFYSHIPTNRFIHEGSQDLFKIALAHPEKEVTWVITGVDQNAVLSDVVNKQISKESLRRYFDLEYETTYTRIYKNKLIAGELYDENR